MADQGQDDWVQGVDDWTPGYNPDVDDADGGASLASPSTSIEGSLGRGAVRGTVPAVGGLAGAVAGAELGAGLGALTGPAAPIASPVLGFAGGLGGAYLGGSGVEKAQDWLLDKVPAVKKFLGQDQEQQQADVQQHPYASLTGELAPNLLLLRPGRLVGQVPEGAGVVRKVMASPTGSRLTGAGVMGAQEAAQEEHDTGTVDPTKVGIAATAGAFMNKPTRFGEAVISAADAPRRVLTNIAQGKPAGAPPPGADDWQSEGQTIDGTYTVGGQDQGTATSKAVVPSQAPGLGDVVGIRSKSGPPRRATVDHYFDNGNAVRLRMDDGTVQDLTTADMLRTRTEPPEPAHEAPAPANTQQLTPDEGRAPFDFDDWQPEQSAPRPPAPAPLGGDMLNALDHADSLERTALNQSLNLSGGARQDMLAEAARLRRLFGRSDDESTPPNAYRPTPPTKVGDLPLGQEGDYAHPLSGEPAADLGELAKARNDRPDLYGGEYQRPPGEPPVDPYALQDVQEARAPLPKGVSIFDAIRKLGGIKPDPGGDIAQIMKDFKNPPFVKRLVNPNGVPADDVRRALQEDGWFGRFEDQFGPNAQETGAYPGDDIRDLYDLMDREARGEKVYHPESSTAGDLAERAYADREMTEAGIASGDSDEEAARKLSFFRANRPSELANDHAQTAQDDYAGLPTEHRERVEDHGYEPGADIGAEHEESGRAGEGNEGPEDWVSEQGNHPEDEGGAGDRGEEAAEGDLVEREGGGEGLTYRTTPGAIAMEHAAEVSRLEAEGSQAAMPRHEGDTFATELGAVDAQGRALPQTIMPGMGRTARQLAAARDAQGRGRIAAAAPQKEAGGMFAPPEEAPGADLFAAPERPAPKPEPEPEPEPVAAAEPRPAKQISLVDYDAAAKRFRTGEMTAAEAMQHFEDLAASSEPIKAALRAYPKDHLAKMDPRNRNESKAVLADSIYSSMLNSFNAKGTYSWSPAGFGGKDTGPTNGIRSAMAKQTDTDIKTAAEERKKRIAERTQTYTDPQTISQFRDFIQVRGLDKLTPEQKIRYDALVADETKAGAAREKEQAQTIKGVQTDVAMELVPTKHTQKGHDLFVVKMGSRVERDVYDRLNTAAKKLGGNFSSYARNGAVPGFQFRTKEAAEKFMEVRNGDVSKADITAARDAQVKDNAVDRLRTMAENMEGAADESLNADRKVNTARRANMAAGAEAQAAANKAMAVTMRNLADAIEGGDVRYLDSIRHRTDVEALASALNRARWEWARAEQKRDPSLRFEKLSEQPVTPEMIDKAPYPWPNAHRENVLELAKLVENKKGFKRDAQALTKEAENAARRGDYLVRADNLQLQGILHAVAQEVAKGKFPYRAQDVLDSFKAYERMQRMGLSNPATMRAALREFLQYRGSAAKADPIKAAERALIGTKIPGYFPTPPRVVDRMLEAAGIEDGMKVLEPSAGKGNILDRLNDAAKNLDVSAIEQQASLRKILEMKGANIVDHNFLDHTGTYDRIVMNPPFENGQDIEHVQHAFGLLNPGGRVVAIMSESPFFVESAKAREFRDWLEKVGGTSEKLPAGSFMDSERSTGVNTRMVTIDKPGHRVEQPGPMSFPSRAGEFKDLGTEFSDWMQRGNYPTDNLGLSQALREYLLNRGATTDHEALGLHDATKNAVTHMETSGQPGSVNYSDDMARAMSDPSSNLVVHHNHPSSRSFSDSDISSLAYPGVRWMVVHGHDGNWFGAKLSPAWRKGIESAKSPGTTNIYANRLESTWNHVGDTVEPAFTNAVKNRQITVDEANDAWPHTVNTMLANHGIIDYRTSKEFAPHVQSVIDQTIRAVSGDYRHPNPIRYDRGIAEIHSDVQGQSAPADAENSEAGSGVSGTKPKVEQPEDRFPVNSSEAADRRDNAADAMAETLRTSAPGTYSRTLHRMSPPSGDLIFKDPNAVQNFTIRPETLARLDTRSATKWNAEKAKEAEANSMVDDLRARISNTMLKLPDTSRDKVYAARELDRINGVVRTDTGHSVVARNDGADFAHFSKPGQVVTLNPKETAAYHALSDMFDRAWKNIMEGAARKVGWTGAWDKDDMDANLRALNHVAETTADDKGLARVAQRAAQIVSNLDAQRRQGYHPLMRFGDYYAHVTPKMGTDMESTGGFPKTVWFELAEKGLEQDLRSHTRVGNEAAPYAKEMLERLQAKFPADKFNVEHGFLAKNPDMLDRVDIPAIEKLMTFMENDMLHSLRVEARGRGMSKGDAKDYATKKYDDLYGRLVDQLWEKAFQELQAGYKKKASTVPGYSPDFDRALGTYMHWTSRNVADQIHRPAIDEADTAMQTDPRVNPNVKRYWKAWTDYQRSPSNVFNKSVNGLARWGFLTSMGVNPSSSAVVGTHGLFMAGPTLSVGIGMKKAAPAYARAMNHVMGAVKVGQDGLSIPDATAAGRTPGEKAFLQRLDSEGILHSRAIEDMAALNEKQSSLWGSARSKARKFMDIALSNVSVMDRANRIASALSAYRLAGDPATLAQMDQAWRVNQIWRDQAEKHGVSQESMASFMVPNMVGEYGKMNQAPIERNAFTRMMMGMHSFVTRLLGKMWQMGSMSPAGRQGLLWTLGAFWLMAGLDGEPFSEDAQNAADFIWKEATGKDPMLGYRIQAGLASMFGKAGANLLLYGPASALSGADVHSRLGLGDLISRNWPTAENTLGAYPSIILGRARAAVQDVGKGEYGQAATEFLPAGVRNAVKAVTEREQGVRTGAGKVTVPASRLTPADTAARALGFTPEKAEEQYQRNDYRYRARRARMTPPPNPIPPPGYAKGGRVEANPTPSDAQIEAGNYKKHHMRLHGFDISIETPRGVARRGVGADGKEWENTHPSSHYGYIRRTEGADGEHVDCYVGPHHESRRIFIVDQFDPKTRRWDEHKLVFGARTIKEAKTIYDHGFSDGSGQRRRRNVHQVSPEELKAWLDSSETARPFAEAIAA